VRQLTVYEENGVLYEREVIPSSGVMVYSPLKHNQKLAPFPFEGKPNAGTVPKFLRKPHKRKSKKHNPVRWTVDQDSELRDMWYRGATNKELEARFSRTIGAISVRANVLSLGYRPKNVNGQVPVMA